MKYIKISEGRIHGWVADMKVHLGVSDFKNALKRVNKLKKYIKELKIKEGLK